MIHRTQIPLAILLLFACNGKKQPVSTPTGPPRNDAATPVVRSASDARPPSLTVSEAGQREVWRASRIRKTENHPHYADNKLVYCSRRQPYIDTLWSEPVGWDVFWHEGEQTACNPSRSACIIRTEVKRKDTDTLRAIAERMAGTTLRYETTQIAHPDRWTTTRVDHGIGERDGHAVRVRLAQGFPGSMPREGAWVEIAIGEDAESYLRQTSARREASTGVPGFGHFCFCAPNVRKCQRFFAENL